MKPPPSAALAEVLEFKRSVNADRASGTPLRGGLHRRTATNRLVRSRGSRAFREDKVRLNSALWSMAVVLPAPAVLMRFCSRFVRAFGDYHLCKRQIKEGAGLLDFPTYHAVLAVKACARLRRARERRFARP
jgi:hypothetical protein